jgi:hypothetical protein
LNADFKSPNVLYAVAACLLRLAVRVPGRSAPLHGVPWAVDQRVASLHMGEMTRPLPSPSQIQEWILKITPDSYFEQFVRSPGLLVLRAKNPRSEYQGLHLALSPAKAQELASALSALEPQQGATSWNVSQPHGRGWLSLFTSGIDFRSWRHIEFKCGMGGADDEIRMGFQSPSLVHLTLNVQALRSLIMLIKAPAYALEPTPFSIIRPEKPLSVPHHLWLWKWGD